MATVTQIQEATNAEGQPIKLAVAYSGEVHGESKYSAYLPVYDTTTKFPPTEPFPFEDRGHHADPSKSNLFSLTTAPDLKVTKLTPHVGTEISGLQLTSLTPSQKDDLALLVAERGVVVFRNQTFKDAGPAAQKAFASSFGRLHIHPVGAHAKDHIEFHAIYMGRDNLYRLGRSASKLSSTGFHSDVSYEHQPPGLTMLTLLQVPQTGGDTAWTSQVAAYERLSEPMKAFLGGLRAEHSGFAQAEKARADGHFVRREPVRSFHPVVRVHPVTGKRALFVNPGFTKRIVGLKDEESEAVLKMLFKHISQSHDVQVRVRWDEETVALWDNRVTAHTAISDYDVSDDAEGLRQGFRITTLGEVPVGVDGLTSEWD